MKILQINSCCGVGSTGRITVDLYNVAKNAGHEGVIAFGRWNAPDNVETIKIGNDWDVYKHAISTRVNDRTGFASEYVTKKFISKIDKVQPDIIHLHNLHGYYINIEVLFNFFKQRSIPIVWTLHDCWPFTGHCAYPDVTNCNAWLEGCNQKCNQKRIYPQSLILSGASENFKKKSELFTSVKNMTLITPSNWLRNLVSQSFLNQYPVYVVANGIDLNTFFPSPSNFRTRYNIKDKHIVLGVASVWSQYKGLNDMIKIATLLGSRYQVVMVGVTEKQRKLLPKSIITIDKTNNVRELAEIYSAADVFVNPTYVDNFPTTNIEALACGTPVITYDTGGSPEAIDNLTGKVVKKGDINSLVNEIYSICSGSILQEDCLTRGKLFNKNITFSKYLDIYESIIK